MRRDGTGWRLRWGGGGGKELGQRKGLGPKGKKYMPQSAIYILSKSDNHARTAYLSVCLSLARPLSPLPPPQNKPS